MLEKITIFEARKGGYRTYRVPGILATPNGTVLVTAEARPEGGDWGNNDIVMRRSTDGGATWGETVGLIRRQDYGPGPLSNFVMIYDINPKNAFTLCTATTMNGSLRCTAPMKAPRSLNR